MSDYKPKPEPCCSLYRPAKPVIGSVYSCPVCGTQYRMVDAGPGSSPGARKIGFTRIGAIKDYRIPPE